MADTLQQFRQVLSHQHTLIHTTLFDLVWAVSEVAEDDWLVVAAVTHLVNSGQAQCMGPLKRSWKLVVTEA